MLAAQRPRPNTRVTNSSGPSWNQKRSTENTHSRRNRLTWTKTKTHRWLKAAGLKAETEGFIIAAQDQSLPTRWHQHNILKKPDVDLKCRLCGRFDETIDHPVSGCPELAKTENIHQQQGSCTHALDDLQSSALRWRNDGMSMNPRLSPRMTVSLFCGTCPSTLTGT